MRQQAAARTTDPATSHAAAAAIEAAGTAQTHRDLIRRIVLNAPAPITAGEIAELAGLETHKVLKRICEISDIARMPARKCTKRGRTMTTYWRPDLLHDAQRAARGEKTMRRRLANALREITAAQRSLDHAGVLNDADGNTLQQILNIAGRLKSAAELRNATN